MLEAAGQAGLPCSQLHVERCIVSHDIDVFAFQIRELSRCMTCGYVYIIFSTLMIGGLRKVSSVVSV